jgi:hypothetical protein
MYSNKKSSKIRRKENGCQSIARGFQLYESLAKAASEQATDQPQAPVKHTTHKGGMVKRTKAGTKMQVKQLKLYPTKNETNNRVIIYTTKFLVQSHCQALALQQDRTQ